jgi:8-oxo-dGTP pyrophosphatase MutT (NUDIX family)
MIIPPEAVHRSLDAALLAARGCRVLVYDEADIVSSPGNMMKIVIPEARNGDPYSPPVAVEAAGGYVVRKGATTLDVLLIFRRGVWDLPKGKLDPGETTKEAALREVEEEVGAEDLSILADLGVTVHGYQDGRQYAVKTTHWFLMETSSTTFEPQEDEEIEDVRWFSWEAAQAMIGYETLRDHMRLIQTLVFGKEGNDRTEEGSRGVGMEPMPGVDAREAR